MWIQIKNGTLLWAMSALSGARSKSFSTLEYDHQFGCFSYPLGKQMKWEWLLDLMLG